MNTPLNQAAGPVPEPVGLGADGATNHASPPLSPVPSDPDAQTSLGRRAAGAALGVARVAGLLASVAILMGIFAWQSDGRFFILENLLGMLRFMSTLAILGLGLTVVLLVGEIDLSFANLYGLSAMVMAVLWIDQGRPLWISIAAGFLVAALVGVFNGVLVTVVKIPSFIATLGSSILVFGFTLYVSDSQRFSPASPPSGKTVPAGESDFFRGLANHKLPSNLPMQVLWMIGVALLFGFIISYSVFGFRLKAIGGNVVAARFARLPIRRYKILAFVIVGLTAALASMLDFAFIGSIQPDAGKQLLFPAFAAVIIGGASLTGGRGTVIGTLSGALLLAVISNGLALNAAGAFVQQMVLGTVTIAAVALDQFSRRLR